MNEKQKYTTEFESALNKFVDELQKYVSMETGELIRKGFIEVFN